MIQMTCPHCDEQVSFSSTVAGFEVKCPSCRMMVDVPDQPPASSPPESSEPAGAGGLPQSLVDELAAQGVHLDQPPKQGGNLTFWGVLLGILVATAGLSWLLAGTKAGDVIGIILAVIAIAVAYGAVRSMFSDGFDLGGAIFVVYLGLVVGTWFGVNYLFQTGTVHIDNFSDEELTVEVDGEQLGTFPTGESSEHKLSKGNHEIVVRGKDGKERKKYSVTVEAKKVYVLNLLEAQKYYKGTWYYGNYIMGAPEDKPKMITSGWFEADVDHLFEKPPEQVKVESTKGMEGLQTARRTYLRRGKPWPQK